MFNLIRNVLFLLPAEEAHHFTLNTLVKLTKLPGFSGVLNKLYRFNSSSLEKQLFNLHFPNPVGLAAGFDKNAEYLAIWKLLGFGFVEIGTVTPKPQSGNLSPRLFRLPKDEALINRMGFNNHGVNVIAERLKSRPEGLIVGGNIGKNKNTPNEAAVDDYCACFKKLNGLVDYFVINVSSPNTPELRDLQEKTKLDQIFKGVQKLNLQSAKPTPILVKISPDISLDQLKDIISSVEEYKLDGLVISNTSVSRKNLKSPASKVESIGMGGLSGKPLFESSTQLVKSARKLTDLPIIGVGGVFSGNDAITKIDSGSNLIQLYSGFVYKGPALIKQICQALVNSKHSN